MILSSLRFLAATTRHKREVYRAGRKLGVGHWQLLVHDLSKYRPSEFVPYGLYFYALPGATRRKAVIDKSQDRPMRTAWLRHIQRNAHHWQFWVLINGASIVARHGTTTHAKPIEALPMPEKYVREMVADWMGAARAYDGKWPASFMEWSWWRNNRDSLILHDETWDHLATAILDWFYPGRQWIKDMTPADRVHYIKTDDWRASNIELPPSSRPRALTHEPSPLSPTPAAVSSQQ